MSVDIDRSRISRGVVTGGGSIVANERYHDTGVTVLLHDIVHILGVREFDVRGGSSVFVLRLKQDHWPTVGDLSLRNDLTNVLHVAGGKVSI
jgi:hypothetical protein